MSSFLGSRLVRVTLALTAVVVVLLVVKVVRVHQETGEFRLTPSAAPSEIHAYGRTYHRGRSGPATSVPSGVQELGATAGGGELFGPRHIATQGAPRTVVPTVLWVRVGGTLWTYALSGGP
jgi:hypothetical protein